MRSLLIAVISGLANAAVAAPLDTPVATVTLAIHQAGTDRLQALTEQPGVLWSLELGSEILLGVDDGALPELRRLPEYLAEPGRVARDDLMVSGHVCGDMSTRIWAVVGGYDLVQVPAPLQFHQQLAHPMLNRLTQISAPRHAAHLSYAKAQINQRDQPSARRADPLVDSIVARVDPERWFQTMSALAAFNRNSYSAGLFTARDWIAQRFSDVGLSASNFEFSLANITSCVPTPAPITLPNVIGTKVGLATPNE